jgi:hypothetical protein
VLADPRFPRWDPATEKVGLDGAASTWADVEYRFWDLWEGRDPQPYLPGEFGYKSGGVYEEAQAVQSRTQPVAPQAADQYMLMVYGPTSDKGKDILGDEQPLPAVGGELWPWTRSMSGVDERGGSPYSSDYGLDFEPAYGNPNGIRDGLVLVLTAGADYVEDMQ